MRLRAPAKHSSVARREEKVALLLQVERLRAQLRLQRRLAKQSADANATPPNGSEEHRSIFNDAWTQRNGSAAENGSARLRAVVLDHELQIAGLRGLLCGHTTSSHQHTPLHRPLLLASDAHQRRATLFQCHSQRLADAASFLSQRTLGVDLTTPYSAVETFQDTVSGDFGTRRFAVTPFPGVHSVRRVFEALRFYSMNIEICVSEHLGNVTVREDSGEDEFEMEGGGFASVRHICSTVPGSATVEGRQAIFAQLGLDRSQPHALMTIHPVDSDELWVHRSPNRLRVRFTGIVKIAQPSPDGCIVLVKWMSAQLRRENTTVSEVDARTVMTHNTDRWMDVLEHVVWDRVYASEREPSPSHPL